MPRRAKLQAAIGGDRRLDPVHEDRKQRARLQDVEFRGGANRSIEILSAATECVGEPEKNTSDLFGLLLLERDDVVVDFNGAERLEKETRAAARTAMDDPGNRGSVFR